MQIFQKLSLIATSSAALISLSSVASAQSAMNDGSDELTGYVAVGGAYLPEYDGADEYQAIPIAAGQVNKGNYYVATRGLGLVANVVDSDMFNAGPVINYRFGRDSDVDNPVISRLREVDDAVEVGGFFSLIQKEVMMPYDNAEIGMRVTQDVGGGHGGLLANFGGNYLTPVRPDLRLGVNAGVNYQSDDYMESYFSIDPNNSARSGLPVYNADGGFNSADLGATAMYAFNEQWGLMGTVQYTRWMAEAGDSPIITQEGNENQFFTALGVTYRF